MEVFTFTLFGLLLIGTIGSTAIEAFLGQSVDDREAFLSGRKKSVMDLLLRGVLRQTGFSVGVARGPVCQYSH